MDITMDETERRTMRSSKIFRRLLVLAGLAALALALSTRADTGRADSAPKSHARTPRAAPAVGARDDPYAYDLNPLGERGFVPSDEAETYTLNQSPREVDAEVGQEATDFSTNQGAPPYSESARRLVKGVLIFLFVAVASMGIFLILYPSERITRAGGRGSRSDG